MIIAPTHSKFVRVRFATHKNLIFLQSGYNSYLQIELVESACSLLYRIKLKT